MSDLTFLSASCMAQQIRLKKLSPSELLEAHLSRIESLHPKLNAFVQVDAEAARRRARELEKAGRSEQSMGALYGVPISIKSSIEVQGMAWEAGTKLRSGRVGSRNAPLVARLVAAGAIILGVTNTPELLMAWETDNILYGRCNNPWDLDRTPGGSSGGEAAAIAAGCSAAGMGSDGGGSIRVPAHFTGICGLKPTPGRIPSTGHFPASAGPFAFTGVVGPMARTIADLKLLFGVVQGADNGDPSSAPVPLRWPSPRNLKGVRIGYFESAGRTGVTAETRAAVWTAVEGLRSASFAVEPFCPEGLEAAGELWWKLFGTAGGMLLNSMVEGRERDLSPLLQEFLGWVRSQPAHTGETLLAVWMQRDLVRGRVLAQMDDFPILLCPVAAIPAFRHGERSWQVDGRSVSYLDAWSYCEWFNLLGFPAAVVPVARSGEGLPIGVQIVGRPWQEETVLAVASAVEASCGAASKPPIA
jgi:Asp-tRNA(Asn)/Glu-tRNA(Gln) amidotransferase A subunit family amidase